MHGLAQIRFAAPTNPIVCLDEVLMAIECWCAHVGRVELSLYHQREKLSLTGSPVVEWHRLKHLVSITDDDGTSS